MKPRFERIAVSMVQNCATTLRGVIFELGDDVLLGSEDRLCEELGVSTPTLRQAARLLEQEQLLTIKRGVAGGYYTRRPGAKAVAHMAAIYLRTHGASIVDMYEVSKPLFELAVRLACRSTSKKFRSELREMAKFDPRKADFALVEWDMDAKLSDLLCKMPGNTVLFLVLSMFSDYGASIPTIPKFSVRDVPREYFALNVDIAAAIFKRDEKSAVEILQRKMLVAHEHLKRMMAQAARSLRGSKAKPARQPPRPGKSSTTRVK
jgi:GntR family transcriptional regulator, transcriptional repressor for pyruvate dehydrogenase complex